MLTKDFNKQDDDFITLKSRIMADKMVAQSHMLMEKLAERGQINAIQEYFKHRNTKSETNGAILTHIMNLIENNSNLEQRYAIGLYLIDRGYKSDAEIDHIKKCFRLEDDDIAKFGNMYLNQTLQMGLREVQNEFFERPCAVLCERFAEIVNETKKMGLLENDSLVQTANSLAAAKIYDEVFGKQISNANYIFAYSTFSKRIGHKNIESNFKSFASRRLNFEAEQQ